MAKKVLSQPSTHETSDLPSPFSMDPFLERHLAGVTPSLRALARSDMEILQRNTMEEHANEKRDHRLSRPAQWWSLTVGSTRTGGISRTSVAHCQVRWKADQLINFDEDGDVIETKVTLARESAQSATTTHISEVQRKSKTCDQCRVLNVECARQCGAIFCNSCVASNQHCREELAALNRKVGFDEWDCIRYG